MQSEFNFTNPEDLQKIASDPKYSIYLSASAGTGKTKVLTDRYLRILLDGSSPNTLLCLTFTNAAATEMRCRISSRLQKWSILNEEELIHDLQKLTNKIVNKTLLNKAKNLYIEFIKNNENVKIQTIHSFCSDILKKYSNHEKSYYYYKIIEEAQKNKLIKEAFDEVLLENNSIITTWIEKLVEYYDIERLNELAFDVLNNNRVKFNNFINSFYDEEEIKTEVYNLHRAEPNLTFAKLLKIELDQVNTNDIAQAAKKLIEEGEELGVTIQNWLNLDLDSKISNFDIYKDAYIKANGEAKDKLIKKKFIENEPQLAKIIYDEQHRIIYLDQHFRKYTSAELNTALILLSKRILEVFEEKKKKLQLLEYDDLISKTIDLLTNQENSSWVLYNLDIILDHILVDEAQDLSEIQWEVIKLISDEFFAGVGIKEHDRTIFIVGDFKQSIYSFQGAEPREFDIAKEFFAKKAKGALKQWQQLNMSISFRSTEEILKYIDEVCIRFSLGVKEHFKHIAYRNGGGHIGILPLIKRIKSEKPENTWQLPEHNDTTYNPKKVTAVQIADEISKWLNEKRVLYGHLRLIEPKDIMILVKKRSEFIEYLISELKKRDIPVLDYEKSNLNNSLIIKDMLSLIKFINLPSDEYNLACLLKSSLIGISEERLFILSFQRDKLLWEELQIKEPDIYNYLNLLIEESKSLSPYQLFHKVLYRDKKYTNLLQRFGDKTKSIIEQFLFAALEFESNQVILNLHQEFYEWFKNNELSFSSTSNENKVKILTIHGAKGLQAPIIFLADAASSEQTPFENIFWDEKGNFFFSSYNEFDSQETKYVKEMHKLKQKEENLRLLYVALSRAEDEIYICGWDNNRINGSWYDILSKIDLPPIKDPLYQSTAITSKQLEVYTEVNTSHPIKLIKKRNITPSQIKTSKIHQTFMKRGIVIHKLLHDLPKLQKTKWSKILSEYDQNITTEVLQTLEKFPHIIFAENSVSEFPITGIVDNQKVNAQIDKVIFHSNLIEIIDFKTNTEPSLKAAQTYTVQLDMYKSLLQQVYPGVKIKAYILFTLNQELIEIIN